MDSTSLAGGSPLAPAPTRASPAARPLLAFVFLLAAGAMLGTSTNVARYAATVGVAPFTLLAWSCVGGSALLLAIGAARGRLPPVDARALRYYLVSAAVGVALPNLIFFSAVPHVGVDLVVLALALPPLFTYVGALALRMERPRLRRALGVALALAGTALVAVLELHAPDARPLWLALCALGPVLLAIGNLYRTRAWPPGAAPDALAPGMLATAAVLLVLASGLPGLSLEIADGTGWSVVALQSGIFALLYLCFFQVQKRGGPIVTSLLGSVAAMVGIPTAWLVFEEPLPEGFLVASPLIAIGLALVLRVGGEARRTPT